MRVPIGVILLSGMPLFSSAISRSINLRYTWETGQVLHYQDVSIEQNTRARQMFAKFIVEVIAKTKDGVILKIRNLNQPDFALFTTIDYYGNLISRKVLINNKNNRGISTSPLSWFQFPRIPNFDLHFDKPINLKGYRYLLKKTNKNNIVRLDISYIAGEGEMSEKRMVRFDIVKGLLLKSQKTLTFIDGTAETYLFELVKLDALDARQIIQCVKEVKEALPEDEFIVYRCAPYLDSKNLNDRRTAILRFCDIKNPKLFEKYYPKVRKAAESLLNTTKWDTWMFMDEWLFGEVKRGNKCAIQYLLLEDWELLRRVQKGFCMFTRSNHLVNLSGLDFHDNKKKWKEWFNRVPKVFPGLESAGTEKLKAGLDDKDPWVRLFALRELAKRIEGPQLATMLEKASKDQDEEVREYAKEKLAEMKDESKEDK